jgi:hypothetical protein
VATTVMKVTTASPTASATAVAAVRRWADLPSRGNWRAGSRSCVSSLRVSHGTHMRSRLVSNDRWITVLGVLVFLAAWSKWLVQKAYGSDGFRGLSVHVCRELRRR